MSRDSFREDDHDIGDLLRLYRRLVTGRGTASLSEDAFERIIDHFDDLDDLGSAIDAADTGIGQHPFSAVLLIKKADLLISAKRYDEAHALLDQAEILDSNDIDIYILRTDAYLAQDLQERAVSLLEEAIHRFEGEDRIDLLFELADVYDDYEAFDKIFDCLKMILSYQPTNEEALYKICFWTDYTGRNEESIRLHESIIDEHPYNELAWFNLAAAYQGLKLYEKAIDAYKYALVINEKFDYAYRNMADAYIRLRKYRDAIEALEKVVELARPEDVIYEAIAHCYDRLQHHAQARFYYRKASHLSPEDAKLQYRVALTYMQESNWVQASKYLELALRLNRNAYDFNLAMGKVQLELGNRKEAMQHFNLIVKIRPRNISGWEALIRCAYESGLLPEAEEYTRTAWVQTGGKPVFRFYRAALLFALGQAREAQLVLESAMIEAPRMLGRMLDLEPSLMQHPQVVDIISRHRRKRG
jgi:tetratricopeptide (TPR) repeat protein